MGVNLVALIFVAFYTIAGILVSLNRFWQYEVFYYDFGIFDQAIWRVSRFQAPVIDHLVVGGKTILADHFNPTIFLLSPLYWMTDRSEIILAAQAIIVGLSVGAIYLLGKTVLKNNFLAFSVSVAYGLFVGLQNAIISDFHEVTIMTLPLALLFLSIEKRWVGRYFLFLILVLGIKENSFLIGIGIALFILITKKFSYRISVATAVVSLLWGFFAIKIAIPYFSGGSYQYSPVDVPTNPLQIIAEFFNHPVKRNTIFFSLGSFAFLPLLFPPVWPLILQDFATRFLSARWFTRWGLGLHYSAVLAVILSVGTIYALSRFKKKLNLIAILLIITAIYLHQFKLHGPLGLSYNPAFYRHTKDFEFLDDLVRRVPPTATVMTQNNLAPRFTHQTVWILRDGFDGFSPDYVVIDARPGQNPNNFFGLSRFSINQVVDSFKLNKNYEILYQTNEQFIFRRITPSSSPGRGRGDNL